MAKKPKKKRDTQVVDSGSSNTTTHYRSGETVSSQLPATIAGNDQLAAMVTAIARDDQAMQALAKANGYDIPEGTEPFLDPMMIALIIDLILKIIAMIWPGD